MSVDIFSAREGERCTSGSRRATLDTEARRRGAVEGSERPPSLLLPACASHDAVVCERAGYWYGAPAPPSLASSQAMGVNASHVGSCLPRRRRRRRRRPAAAAAHEHRLAMLDQAARKPLRVHANSQRRARGPSALKASVADRILFSARVQKKDSQRRKKSIRPRALDLLDFSQLRHGCEYCARAQREISLFSI